MPCNDVALFFFGTNCAFYGSEYVLRNISRGRSQHAGRRMGIKAKSGLVFLVADKLTGIDPEPCEHGMRYRNGQSVEQEHFQLIAGYALKRASA